MSSPRLDGRLGFFALFVLSAAAPIGPAPREAGAQSRGPAASMAVSVTVERSCRIDTGEAAASSASSASTGRTPDVGAGVKLTCSPNRAGLAPQPFFGRVTIVSVGGTPDSAPSASSTAERRLVIQF